MLGSENWENGEPINLSFWTSLELILGQAKGTRGWSKRGKIIQYKVPVPKAENYSVLPALTVNGYIACNVYQGAVNVEMFRDFIEHDLLPLCKPFPGPRSIIVMDNAAIHNLQFPLCNVAQ
jgi:DDE superfamily endonuclease